MSRKLMALFAVVLILAAIQWVPGQIAGPDIGYVTITSEPTGAVVSIDGYSVGTTPVQSYELSAETHQLTANLIGFREISQSFSLGPGEQKAISLHFTPIAPTLPPTTLTTAPTTIPPTEPVTTITIGGGKGWITTHCNVNGAAVTFDDDRPGCTITQGECTVEVGTTWSPYRSFSVRYPGFQTYTGSVTSWPSERQTIHLYATLNPIPPQSGSISATSSPAGAGIYLNGNFQGYSPFTIPDLEPRTYTIAAKLNGYTPVSQYLTVYAGQTAYFSPVLQPSPPPPRDTGDVYFTSSPPGAQVYVDGTYRGVTPVTVSLFPGSHSVLMRLSGYNDWTNTVYVTSNSRQTVNAALSRYLVYGWVTIASNPGGANVYFDSVYKGQTDSSGAFTINGVQPGVHSLQLTKQGYRDYQTSVSVSANTEAYVPVILTPQGTGPTPTPVQGGGAISIVSSPSGAEVYLDNIYMGYTPVTLTSVAPGTRTVMLKASGYQDSVNSVPVTPGSTTPLTVILIPATPPPTTSGSTPLPGILGALGALFLIILARRDY